MKPTAKPTFRAAKFLKDQFETVQGLEQFLKEHQFSVPLDTCRKWIVRDSIPTEWLLTLLLLLESGGVEVTIQNYLVGGRSWISKKKKPSPSGSQLDVFA